MLGDFFSAKLFNGAEKSDSLAREACTGITTSLERYAIRATDQSKSAIHVGAKRYLQAAVNTCGAHEDGKKKVNAPATVADGVGAIMSKWELKRLKKIERYHLEPLPTFKTRRQRREV